MFGRVFSAVTNVAQRISTISGINTASSVTAISSQISGGAWSLVPVRSKIRVYFPRPNETKRINKHGWLKRMSTIGGRRILMKRILKQKHVLSH